ncbi:hypothetical protein ACLOJK_023749 [Asimina triloba]
MLVLAYRLICFRRILPFVESLNPSQREGVSLAFQTRRRAPLSGDFLRVVPIRPSALIPGVPPFALIPGDFLPLVPRQVTPRDLSISLPLALCLSFPLASFSLPTCLPPSRPRSPSISPPFLFLCSGVKNCFWVFVSWRVLTFRKVGRI